MPKGNRGGNNNGGAGGGGGAKKENYYDVEQRIRKELEAEQRAKQSAYIEKRFEGLNAKEKSNNYYTMDRVSADGETVVVKVGDNHLIKTRYGGALVLDDKHVVFLKDGQFTQNYYGNEVMLKKSQWQVKEWGDHSANFGAEPQNHNFDRWAKSAKAQQKAGTEVLWEKTAGEKTTSSFQRSQLNKKVTKLARAEWEKMQKKK